MIITPINEVEIPAQRFQWTFSFKKDDRHDGGERNAKLTRDGDGRNIMRRRQPHIKDGEMHPAHGQRDNDDGRTSARDAVSETEAE